MHISKSKNINKIKCSKLCIYAGVFIFSFFVPLIFAIYTDHAWEDWYITYRSSKNLATGNGLVYSIGERIHSFTSPLGTLIPALLNFLTGNSSDDLVLWLYRIFNCALLGSAAVLLCRISDILGLEKWSRVFLIGMFILDAKVVDFSINGMETGLMVFFLILSVYALLLSHSTRWILLGMAWGGLMWTRPDSFIYVSAVSFGIFIFLPRTEVAQNRSKLVRHFFNAGLVASAIYIPWLLWAWFYYGSFVPHTVIAKGLSHDLGDVAREFLGNPIGLSIHYLKNSFGQIFTPSYTPLGGWPVLIQGVSLLLSLFAAFLFLVPRLYPLTRALSIATLFGHVYLNLVVGFIFSWYIPTVGVLSILVLALTLDQLLKWIEAFQDGREFNKGNTSSGAKMLVRSFTVLALIFAASMTILSAYQLRIQQKIVEDGHRRQIGLWLRQHASSGDRVFLEPLGYIGFFSGLKMLDIPGLSSPEVVAARKALQTDEPGILISDLKPEWIVLRPFRIAQIRKTNPSLLTEDYSEAQIFDVSEQIASYPFLPGRGYLEYDQTFFVFRRN